DDAVTADGLPQLRHGLIDERLQLPASPTAAHIVEEVAEDAVATRRVAHLGMELQAEDRSAAMADGGKRARFRGRQRYEVAVDPLDLVAVAHPHRGFRGDAAKQAVAFLNAALSPAKLPAGRWDHLASQELTRQLHAIADPQNRNVQLEQGRIA